MLIKEGQVAQSNERIVYPTINSCMTVTCIFAGPKFVGGHCVLIPTGNQLGYAAVAHRINGLSATAGQRTHVYFVGVEDFWPAARLKEMQEILSATNVTKINTTDYDTVDVEFLPTGFVNLVKQPGSQIKHQARFG